MSLTSFAEEYSQLPSGEQAQFEEAIRRLLTDGLIWREIENERRLYAFLMRRRQLVGNYLQVAGWELRHDERLAIFQVIHREGAHRRRLNRDTTIWLLLLRLIYAEDRESTSVTLTRYPVTTVGEVIQRYAEFFPKQPVRKKTSLDEALRILHGLKLIRAADGRVPRAANTDQMLELLPTLEVVVPAADVAALAEQLATYDRSRTGDDNDGE